MGIIDNLKILGKRIIPSSPIVNNEVGLYGLNYNSEDPRDKEATYPQWFFSSRLGQPRNVDINTLRRLAKSPWAQMVMATFKKQVFTTDWVIKNADEEDESDKTIDIKKVTDFLNRINSNKQTIDDINSELITDIAEIDAACINYIYTADSYTVGQVPVYDAWGRIEGYEIGLVLKPLSQRELRAVKTVDGSTMLKQVDIHKNLLNYWQYSFKNPRQNPTHFEPDEIEYIMMNDKSYSVYGFSPIQAVQQVLELLIQGTRYNKDLYTNNAIPDIMISLPKAPIEQLKKLKRQWNNEYKGKPHQVGFINWMIEAFHKLTDSNRDLEWLDGQKWYFKLVFAVFGVSPEEAGFFEDSNRSTSESQERITVRNAIKPYYKKFEQYITNKLITEILQKEDHGLKFEYIQVDHALEKTEFDQNMQELDRGIMTINEYRRQKGLDSVEWGDEPLRRPFNPEDSFSNFGGNNPTNQNNPNINNLNDEQQKSLRKQIYRKDFERFLNDGKQATHNN